MIPSSAGGFRVNNRVVYGGGWNDHFWHLNHDRTAVEPMQAQERHDLRFSITSPDGGSEPTPTMLGSPALHHRSLLFMLRIGFTAEQPTSIWKFEGASLYAHPDTANEYNRVRLDTKSTATMTLRDVRGGLFNAFAWNWDG